MELPEVIEELNSLRLRIENVEKINLADFSCKCNPRHPKAKPFEFELPGGKKLIVDVGLNGDKELGVRIFSEDKSINDWMRNRVQSEGSGKYKFEAIARNRTVTVCGASKDCYNRRGCPDRDWFCGYMVGDPIIHRENEEFEVNWDDSRPEGVYKNITVYLTIK